MSPAPANDSAALPSPFFMTSTAAPLSVRDCNGFVACPAVCKAPAALAIRRGASFLDVDDACLALSDKASFLIPEDSYLPGQENCVAPCAPAAPIFGRRPCPCPAAGAIFPAAAALHPATACSRSCLSTPFLLMDAPGFGVLAGEEEFVAASVCFEKAVQALEMVERPVELGNPTAAHRPMQHRQTASGDGNTLAIEYQAHNDTEPVRRVSSLVPSPAASQQAGSEQDPTASYRQSGICVELERDAAESSPAVPSSSTSGGFGEDMSAHAAAAHSACAPGCWQYQPAGVGPTLMAAMHVGGALAAVVAADKPFANMPQAGAAMEAAIPSAPAAPLPKAFHHKTGGPCDHCGATESPQWRRGPPAKPMLCNACGTRYRRTNQLSPAAALSPAGRAAAAAATAAAAAAAAQPAAKRGTKRDPSSAQVSAAAAKRGRSASAYY